MANFFQPPQQGVRLDVDVHRGPRDGRLHRPAVRVRPHDDVGTRRLRVPGQAETGPAANPDPSPTRLSDYQRSS